MKKQWIIVACMAIAPLAAAEEAAPPPTTDWTGNFSFGYISSTGNSESKNLDFGSDTKKELPKWRHALHLEAHNASSDGVRDTENYLGSWQTNYKFNQRQSVFGRVEYENDRFSSYKYQTSITAGYSQRLIDTDRYTFDLEGGGGYRRSETVNHEVQNEPIVRLAGAFVWHISATATFKQDLSTETGTDNTIARSGTRLIVDINTRWAVKLGYDVKWTHNIEPGKKHTDTQTTVAILYKF